MTTQDIEKRLDTIELKEENLDFLLRTPFSERPEGHIKTNEEIESELKALDKEWNILVDLM